MLFGFASEVFLIISSTVAVAKVVSFKHIVAEGRTLYLSAVAAAKTLNFLSL